MHRPTGRSLLCSLDTFFLQRPTYSSPPSRLPNKLNLAAAATTAQAKMGDFVTPLRPANPLRTAYLGPEASFSHQAAIAAVPATEAYPLPSFASIFTALQTESDGPRQHFDFGVLPVENSTNGSVVQALDLLAKCGLEDETSLYSDIEVVDEYYLEVHHCLFVSRSWAEHMLSQQELKELNTHDRVGTLPGLTQIIGKLRITSVHSHPQVWGQCNNFLSHYLPPGQVERIDTSSTSAAASFVATSHPATANSKIPNEPCAAICSILAGRRNKDLLLIASNIEDEPGANTTRFLVLRNINSCRQSHDPQLQLLPRCTGTEQLKSIIALTTAHDRIGSLQQTLAIFGELGFNLCAIQSRPRPRPKSSSDNNPIKTSLDTNWKYVFFVECLWTTERSDFRLLTARLREMCENVRVLGTWRDRTPKS